jgi:hypothetical protein
MTIASIDPKLSAAIAAIESSGDPWATRFEPALYWRQQWMHRPSTIGEIMTACRCNAATARVIYCTSFGLYQIMGFNLYGACNVRVSAGEYMSNAALQNDALASFLRTAGFAATADDLLRDNKLLMHFATMYNGVGNVANYANKLKAALGGK